MKLFSRCNSNVTSLQGQFTIHCQTLQQTAWREFISQQNKANHRACSSLYFYLFFSLDLRNTSTKMLSFWFCCDLVQKCCLTFLCTISSLHYDVAHGGSWAGNKKFSFPLLLASLAFIETSMWKVGNVHLGCYEVIWNIVHIYKLHFHPTHSGCIWILSHLHWIDLQKIGFKKFLSPTEALWKLINSVKHSGSTAVSIIKPRNKVLGNYWFLGKNLEVCFTSLQFRKKIKWFSSFGETNLFLKKKIKLKLFFLS